jgi:hypothetical protein
MTDQQFDIRRLKAIKKAIRFAFAEYGLSIAPELVNHTAAQITAELRLMDTVGASANG